MRTLQNQIQTITSLLLLLPLAGCPRRAVQSVTEPGKAVALDKSEGHAILYDARGRGAYVTFEPRPAEDETSTAALMRVCAEPPPDVAANLAAESSIKQTIDAALEIKSIDAAFGSNTESNATATSTIADAATRTELVLLMRDALYRICELQMNGTMNAPQAREAFESVLGTMRNLGQRANVALLIDALKFIVGSKEEKALEQIPALLSLISNLTVLDVGLAAGNEVLETAATAGILRQFGLDLDETMRMMERMEPGVSDPQPSPPPTKPATKAPQKGATEKAKSTKETAKPEAEKPTR